MSPQKDLDGLMSVFSQLCLLAGAGRRVSATSSASCAQAEKLAPGLDREKPVLVGGGDKLSPHRAPHPASPRSLLQTVGLLAGVIGLVCLAGVTARAADLAEARQQWLSGRYTNCVALAEQAIREDSYQEEWRLLLARSLLTLGRFPEARAAITNALPRYPWSLRLRLLAREVLLSNGQADRADEMLEAISQLASPRSLSYGDPASLVALGRAALLLGADPRRVLDNIFETAKKADPSLREVYLAKGELALDKHDFDLAAKTFQEGLKKLPDDPDLHFGLARAYAPSEPALMIASLGAAMSRNSNHVASLLLLADHLIDAEDYTGAEKLLDHALSVNPWHPEAWAYRAVIAHVQNQPAREQTARATALRFWPRNPQVPHLIGLKLSQKYRFAEGAEHQREALKFDKRYLPAKAQLAQDLLRLGEETEGWHLAEEVQEQDGYDVNALNLMTLHDTMAKFQALTNDHFIVRMSRHEAAVYGPRVLELLEAAWQRLCAKYGLELNRPVLVEVFPEQKDFAVRTFGLPENHGFLGVCFGTVVTANSPASRPGQSFNWESMLWHEFCHVVTLQLTHNKMPRWLSEGISVYEERQANPAWGEHLTPRYREMIVEDELAPVSKLSAAFLTPRSERHLQFAYYESSLVVEFLVQRFGLDKLKAILGDLGEGAAINQALEKHTLPMARLEKEFAAYARAQAEQLAPGLDWEKPDLGALGAGGGRVRRPSPVWERPGVTKVVPLRTPTLTTNAAPLRPPLLVTNTELALDAGDAWSAWAKSRPTNFYVLTRQAQELVEAKAWAEAKPVLQRLIKLYPTFTGTESPYALLTEAHRALGETNAERQVLAQWARLDADAAEAYQRLMELGASAQDWNAVVQNARRYLAVNPLVALPYRFLAQASEAQGQTAVGIEAYRALAQLDPPNPAEVHFHLAQLLHRTGDPAARRHVLQALEDAPRYRAALKLLLEINKAQPGTNTTAAAGPEGNRP